MAQYISVRFQQAGKLYDFQNRTEASLHPGDFVVVETSRGREMGWVARLRDQPSGRGRGGKRIVRKATAQDLVMREHFQQQEKDALAAARMQAVEAGIRIKLARAEYSFDGSRLTYYFGSEKDVDLGVMKRELSRFLDVRVEFRQIGPRDVAKMIGGSGACGLDVRCCSAFLTDFKPISIRMAKAQDLPLVPTEIAGMCGRLRCCLAYEYEFYKDARKGMPKVGKWVSTPEISGKVVDRNIPKQTVTIRTEAGTRTEMAVKDLWVGDSGQPPAQGGSCGTGAGHGAGCASCAR